MVFFLSIHDVRMGWVICHQLQNIWELKSIERKRREKSWDPSDHVIKCSDQGGKDVGRDKVDETEALSSAEQ